MSAPRILLLPACAYLGYSLWQVMLVSVCVYTYLSKPLLTRNRLTLKKRGAKMAPQRHLFGKKSLFWNAKCSQL